MLVSSIGYLLPAKAERNNWDSSKKMVHSAGFGNDKTLACQNTTNSGFRAVLSDLKLFKKHDISRNTLNMIA